MPSIGPYITSALRGTKIKDISFIDHPPSKWSWHIALALKSALLDPKTKRYWSSHPEMTLQEMGIFLGQTWVRRSKLNFGDYPEIYPHATALLETLLLRSEPALLRLYQKNGSNIGHCVAQGMQREGIEQYSQWLSHYYDMRQSIETDEVLQMQLSEHISLYPTGWTDDKETQFKMSELTSWPLFPYYPPMESTMTWFNPRTMASQPVRAINYTSEPDATAVDEIDGRPYEAIEQTQNGHSELIGPLGQLHNVGYQLKITYSHLPIARARPLHVEIIIKPSLSVSEDLSLQQLHAMFMVQSITENLQNWLNAPLVKEQLKGSRFEPSFSIDCQIRDPIANSNWQDTTQEEMQQFMNDYFSWTASSPATNSL